MLMLSQPSTLLRGRIRHHNIMVCSQITYLPLTQSPSFLLPTNHLCPSTSSTLYFYVACVLLPSPLPRRLFHLAVVPLYIFYD